MNTHLVGYQWTNVKLGFDELQHAVKHLLALLKMRNPNRKIN
ncbi:hypothetical protein ACFPIA_07535 [Pediococcus cellicola]